MGVSASDAKANIVTDGQVVTLMGHEVDHSTDITKTMHFRVVAMGDNNRVSYQSSWMPDNATTLTDWSQVEGCNWANN